MAPERITLKDPSPLSRPREPDVGALHRAPGPRARAISRRARGHPAGGAGVQDGGSPLPRARHRAIRQQLLPRAVGHSLRRDGGGQRALRRAQEVLLVPARRRAAPPRDGPGRVRAGRHPRARLAPGMGAAGHHVPVLPARAGARGLHRDSRQGELRGRGGRRPGHVRRPRGRRRGARRLALRREPSRAGARRDPAHQLRARARPSR